MSELLILPFRLLFLPARAIKGFPHGTLFIILFAVAVLLGAHAVQAHGQEAVDARNCVNKHGSIFIFQEPNNRFHRLCVADSGEIFDQIVAFTEKGIKEITAFKPNPWANGNTWKNIYYWLKNKNGTLYRFIDGMWREIPLDTLLGL